MPDEGSRLQPHSLAPVPRNPVLIDRHAMERVLARAAELQGAGTGAEPGDELTEAQLLEIAREVGLSETHLRQAMAEERARVPVLDDGSFATRVAGPATAAASRVVRRAPADVLSALDTWMQREECLRLKRRFPDRLTWEPRSDLWSGVRRAVGGGGKSFALARAWEVAATVVVVDDTRTLVRLEADLSSARLARLRAAGASAGAGAAAGGTLVAVGVTLGAAAVAVGALAVFPVVAGAAGAWAVARSHRDVAARTGLALEQMLDRLEHEERPRGTSGAGAALLDAIASAARGLR